MKGKSKSVEVLTRPTISMAGEVKHDVQTIQDNGSWTVNVSVNGKLNQAQKVPRKSDVPIVTKSMLRVEHILGNYSAYTRAAMKGAESPDRRRMAA